MARRRHKKASGAGLLGIVVLGGIILLIQFVGQHLTEFMVLAGVLFGLWALYKLVRLSGATANDSVPSSPPQSIALNVTAAKRSLSSVDVSSLSDRGGRFWRSANGTPGTEELGNLIYVGTGLLAIGSDDPEPALIDPTLPVDRRVKECQRERLSYWPSYSSCSPQARASYLHWLRTSRCDPTANISYVFLYFYGLERRALYDALREPAANSERPAIEAEVQRLLTLYRANSSFQGYAEQFLEFLEFLAAQRFADRLYLATPNTHADARLTITDRIALGQCARDRAQLPVAWAHHWVTHASNITAGAVVHRHPEEFANLFGELYGARYGAGMMLPADGPRIELAYRAASPSFRGVENGLALSTAIPDVSQLTKPSEELSGLVAEARARLSRYSRKVGKDPSAASTLEGLVELPVSLWPSQYKQSLEKVRKVVARSGRPAAVPFSKFRTWLPEFEQITRGKHKALSVALAGVGLGMEPDLRFGGQLPSFESRVILFADDPATSAAEASAQYLAAALTLQLAAAVAGADGTIANAEQALMAQQIHQSLGLTESERRRLNALLRLILIEPPKLPALKRKVSALEPGAREVVGDFLVSVARADSKITPEEIRTLQKIFEMLALDSNLVFSKVHAADVADNAVPNNLGDAPAPRAYAIPRPPVSATKGPVPEVKLNSTQPHLSLDLAKILALQKDSERVARILAPVFDQPLSDAPAVVGPEPLSTSDASQASPSSVLLGLDPVTSEFLRLLIGRPEWTQVELAELAQGRGLMLAGVLERLNEASYDKLDMPLFDDGDPLVLNQEAIAGVSGDQHPQS